MMRIVHVSDLHIKSGRAFAFNAADSSTALERTVAHLAALKQPPDCIVISGDIAEHGDDDAYDFVRNALKPLTMPIYILPGNHDARETLRARLGDYCPAEPDMAPFLCYTVEDGPVRLVIADTSEPEQHFGRLHPSVAAWLEHVLAKRSYMPTMVFTHHPPFPSGMGIMDEPFVNGKAFSRILARNLQTTFHCGHLHRGLATLWEGVPAVICPPLVMRIDLDLSPEGGDAFFVDAPEYVLYDYDKGRINAHFCTVPGDFPQSGPYSFANPPAQPERLDADIS